MDLDATVLVRQYIKFVLRKFWICSKQLYNEIYIEFKSRVMIFLIIKMAEKKRVTFTIEQKNKFLSGANSIPKKVLLRLPTSLRRNGGEK